MVFLLVPLVLSLLLSFSMFPLWDELEIPLSTIISLFLQLVAMWNIFSIFLEIHTHTKTPFHLGSEAQLVQSSTLRVPGGKGEEVPLIDIKPSFLGEIIGEYVLPIEREESMDAILTSDSLNDALFRENVSFEFCTESNVEKKLLRRLQYRADDFYDYITLYTQRKRCGGYRIYNGRIAALVSDININSEGNMVNVHLAKTSFFTGLLTNNASTEYITKKGEIYKDFRSFLFPACRTSRCIDDAEGIRMQPIGASFLSNYIGISNLVLTRDHYLVIWLQGNAMVQSGGLYVASGSGSLEWGDVTKNKTRDFLDVLKHGMKRETREESSLSREAESLLDTRVLGYFRWVRHGGKPEFFGVSRTALYYRDFVPNTEEVNDMMLSEKILCLGCIKRWEHLQKVCDKLLTEDQRRLSVPLAAILWRIREILSRSDVDDTKKEFIKFFIDPSLH